ncbi:hypothetical protein KAH37_05800, partial [bacterium]|nr:hypothetical protein [bacterium]
MRRFLKNYLYLFMPVLFAFSLLGGGSGTLALQQKLASNSDKSFGDSIDSDNGTLIVGSIGGAHIFRYNSVSGIWERTAHLPVGAPFSSVTVGIDANRAVVALPDERTVHIFERSDGASDVWKKVKSISRPYSVDFGGAVSLVGDTVFVGAFRENMSRGALYIFEKNEGGESVWGEKKKISFSSSFGFGLSVVSDGDRVFVGTDGDMAVYLFEKNSGGKGAWGLVKKIEMPFSASFAASLAVDGDTIVVGAPYDESQKGAFYIFEKDQGGLDNWGEVQRFEGETEYGRIAKYVALKDGVIAVSSRSFSNYKNPVFIFTRRGDDTNLWKKTATILYDDKDSIVSSLTIDNGSVMAGMPWHSSYNGAVALFEKGSEEGSLYEERYKIILHPELDPYFADKVAISGNRAVVTSPDYNS